MKEPARVPKKEWNFASVPDVEVPHCLWHEYGRAADTFKTLVAAWREGNPHVFDAARKLMALTKPKREHTEPSAKEFGEPWNSSIRVSGFGSLDASYPDHFPTRRYARRRVCFRREYQHSGKEAMTRTLPQFIAFERARAYVSKIPGAIEGNKGDCQTLAIANVLLWDLALSPSEALVILREYNARCSPPWTEAELIRKLQSAEKQPHSKPRGNLLGEKSSDWRVPG